MRPGSAVATACLAVLSVWRFVDGQVGWAAVFAGLALVQLAFALRGAPPRRVGTGVAASTADTGSDPATDPVRRTWVRIAVLNLVLAVGAVFWFPPLALVLAGLGLYSTHRARTQGRTQGRTVEPYC